MAKLSKKMVFRRSGSDSRMGKFGSQMTIEQTGCEQVDMVQRGKGRWGVGWGGRGGRDGRLRSVLSAVLQRGLRQVVNGWGSKAEGKTGVEA